MDVYEWEAAGAGSCPSAAAAEANGGCVYLISSGQSGQASYFADADREGRNVYLMTDSGLVPADKDGLYDVYDARVEGGLESQQSSRTLAPSCESRQACQGPQSSAAEPSTPASSSFVGPGNPKPAVRRSCARPARQAGSLSRRAKRLRRDAGKVRNAEQARRMRRKAHRLAARARRKSRQVRSCRRRRAGNDRGGKK